MPRPRTRPAASRPVATLRSRRPREFDQHRELLRIGVLRLIQQDAPALRPHAIEQRRVAQHRHRRVNLVRVGLHSAGKPPHAVTFRQFTRERRGRRGQPALERRHPGAGWFDHRPGRTRRLKKGQESPAFHPGLPPDLRALLAEKDIFAAAALHRHGQQFRQHGFRGCRWRTGGTALPQGVRGGGVNLPREIEDHRQRNVAQERRQLIRSQHRKGHGILFDELLPQRLVILRNHGRIEIDAHGLAVGARQFQAETVNRSEERRLQLVQGRKIRRARGGQLLQQHLPGALFNLGRGFLGVGDHGRLAQPRRAPRRQGHGRQALRDRRGLARARVGTHGKIRIPFLAEPRARRDIGQRLIHRPPPFPPPGK